jgi:hypothetical protein
MAFQASFVVAKIHILVAEINAPLFAPIRGEAEKPITRAISG